MKVLIVEDEFVCRKLLQSLLAPYGTCDVAANGQEAVQAFTLARQRKELYDLILMDIVMPEMDGHEALREIRELEKTMGVTGSEEVKVIMITALDDPKNVVKAFYEGGAISYIAKPVDRGKLNAAIKALGFSDVSPGF
ncbi:MAG: response regulator [Deltaproteobacteria bacterium]|nr:response regulator [Deltaproteobacteria bacterium]